MNISKRMNLNWLPASLAGAACVVLLTCPNPAFAGKATVAPNAIWAHDQLYGTVATDTSFKSPPQHSTDIIYSFADSGLDGQRSVSETAPGDRKYNGGRWNVMAVTFTAEGLAFFDENDDDQVDFELTNAEDVLMAESLGLVNITKANFYFVCPLRRQ